MIKIDKPSGVTSRGVTTRRRDTNTSGTGAFSELMESLSTAPTSVASAPEAVEETQGVMSVDGLLSIQGVSEELLRRRKQLKQAHLTLDSLEELRRALLMGEVPVYLLRTLEERMASMRREERDPAMREVLEEIELRAAVELAKLRF